MPYSTSPQYMTASLKYYWFKSIYHFEHIKCDSILRLYFHRKQIGYIVPAYCNLYQYIVCENIKLYMILQKHG